MSDKNVVDVREELSTLLVFNEPEREKDQMESIVHNIFRSQQHKRSLSP